MNSYQKEMTDEAILEVFGMRMAKLRLDRNITQAQLAENAGVSKRTIERLEQGQSLQLSSLIRVWRTLEILPRLELLLPEAMPSPLEQLKLQGKTRHRSRPSKSKAPSKSKWVWGQ